MAFASIAWGALVVGMTEFLSARTLLSRPGVVIGWCCVDVVLVSTWVRFARQRASLPRVLCDEWTHYRSLLLSFRSGPGDIRLMTLAIALLAAFLGCVALLTPPTNWDSLTYHLPRVMHWIQQRSVEHYQTGNIGQLQMGPWSAFVQTHLFLLCGNDRFANLVQWSAMCGCLFVTTLLARQLWPTVQSDARRLQIFTALLVVTLPTGIVESITTQTDYAAAFWVICFMSLAVALGRSPKSLSLLSGAALAVGLALLTKITTVLYLAPVGAATGLWLAWRWRSPGIIAGRALLVALLVISPVLPHALRNQRVFGWTAGSRTTQQDGQNAKVNVGVVLSNAIRNAALHTNTGILPLTRFANGILKALHGFTGRGLNDPGTSIPEGTFAFQERFYISDSSTGNPYHLALILNALTLAICRPRKNAHLLLYSFFLVISCLLFCLVIRWQMWNSRYHLPYFISFMPFVSVVTVSRCPRWAVNAIAVGLTLFAAVILVTNRSRPVFDPAFWSRPRAAQSLILYLPQLEEQLDVFAKDVVASGCSVVGLKFNSDDGEYPVWTSLRQHGFRGHVESVYADNETAAILRSPPDPCVILAMSARPPRAEVAEQFPHRLGYGLVTAYWSKQASRWAQLTYFDFARNSFLSLPAFAASIPFDRQTIYLFVRIARSGMFRLDADVVGSADMGLGMRRLRVVSDAGYSEELSGGEKISLAMPVPAGTTRVRISLMDQLSPSQRESSLKIIRWAIEAGQDR